MHTFQLYKEMRGVWLQHINAETIRAEARQMGFEARVRYLRYELLGKRVRVFYSVAVPSVDDAVLLRLRLTV